MNIIFLLSTLTTTQALVDTDWAARGKRYGTYIAPSYCTGIKNGEITDVDISHHLLKSNLRGSAQFNEAFKESFENSLTSCLG